MSDDSDDDFVTYGTPLDPLDEDAIPKKKAITLADQVAVDSKGRRRFHGAFTGGFSAGFMNTVGSLEGWKPAEFKSSRSERGVFKSQRPEDLMDDEDLGEFGIAPTRLMARSEFSEAPHQRKRAAPMPSDGPIPGTPVLHELLRPVRETVGVRLLQAMGWKPGQGIGPRVAKKDKVYGCALPPGLEGEDEDEDDDEDMSGVTFAPDDVQALTAAPKKDTFGLGYSGLDRRSVLGSQNVSTGLNLTEKNKKVRIGGQAFGVGAMEDEDEDIYTKEDMSQYDFALGGSPEKPKSRTNKSEDGVLEGFVASKNKVVLKAFPLPILPKGFQPMHMEKPSRFEQATEPSIVSAKRQGLARHELTASSRGVILGEPSTECSKISASPSPPVSSAPLAVSGAKNQFRPFQMDEDKQRRYEQYLKLSDKDKLSELQPVHMNQWDKNAERKEFEQAARIFSPLTGIMEDRFTHGQHAEDLNNPLAAIEKIKHGNETQRNAAQMKMFGKLTRDQKEWQPCALLCKRFNVPEPLTSQPVEPVKRLSKYSIFDSLDALMVKKEPISEPPTPRTQVEEESTEKISETNTATSVGEAEELFADPVSKVDLFKAIFLDSSSEEEEESAQQVQPKVVYDEPIENIARNTSPARGLFADVDLDALAERTSPIPLPVPIVIPNPPKDTNEKGKEEPPELYGPKIPDKRSTDYITVPQSSSSSEDDWVEKDKHESKKNKKHKKHKSKHKKKKKKHKK